MHKNLVLIWADVNIQLNIQLIPGCQLQPVPRIDRCPPWPMLLSALLTLLHSRIHSLHSWLLSTHCNAFHFSSLQYFATLFYSYCVFVNLHIIDIASCTVPYFAQYTFTAMYMSLTFDCAMIQCNMYTEQCAIHCSLCIVLGEPGRWLPRYTGVSFTYTPPLLNHQAGWGKHSTHVPSQ